MTLAEGRRSRDGRPGGRPARAAVRDAAAGIDQHAHACDQRADCAAEQEAARAAVRALAGRPFDLVRRPPVRLLLLRLGPEEHVLALVVHHLVSDGWSTAVFLRELAAKARPHAEADLAALIGLGYRRGLRLHQGRQEKEQDRQERTRCVHGASGKSRAGWCTTLPVCTPDRGAVDRGAPQPTRSTRAMKHPASVLRTWT